MKTAEMNRRLAAITSAQTAKIREDIAIGDSAYAIAGYKRGEFFKAVNAVFELVAREAKAARAAMRK